MNIGELNKRVTIQAKTSATNALGDSVETWTDTATRWAAVEPLTGREFWQAQQVNSELTVKITIRYYSALVTANRIKYGTRYFDILSIQNIDEENVWMVLLCKEVI